MAPTESTILTNYLTVAAKLPAILTLEQFASYFPRAQQSNPQIRTLYRHLQHQRNSVVDSVAADIAAEEKRSKAMRRAAARARREAGEGTDVDADPELQIERALLEGQGGENAASSVGVRARPQHSLNSLVPEMDGAIADLEAEVLLLEAQEAALRKDVRQTVGGLSDLRYGRLSNARLPGEVVEGLKDLRETCDARN